MSVNLQYRADLTEDELNAVLDALDTLDATQPGVTSAYRKLDRLRQDIWGIGRLPTIDDDHGGGVLNTRSAVHA